MSETSINGISKLTELPATLEESHLYMIKEDGSDEVKCFFTDGSGQVWLEANGKLSK